MQEHSKTVWKENTYCLLLHSDCQRIFSKNVLTRDLHGASDYVVQNVLENKCFETSLARPLKVCLYSPRGTSPHTLVETMPKKTTTTEINYGSFDQSDQNDCRFWLQFFLAQVFFDKTHHTKFTLLMLLSNFRCSNSRR